MPSFNLEEEDPQELTKRMQKQWIVKKAGQPLAHQSAGCIFKNPRGISAGMLIDQAGIEGHPGWRRGSERSPREFHRGRSRRLEPTTCCN